jgi:hypothetical protein
VLLGSWQTNHVTLCETDQFGHTERGYLPGARVIAPDQLRGVHRDNRPAIGGDRAVAHAHPCGPSTKPSTPRRSRATI